jgi:hypothetical protein
MVKCSQFATVHADDEGPGRQLVLVEADSVADLDVLPALPSEHFVCLVVWDAPSEADVILTFARTIIAAGAVYVCTFGDGSERVHDAVDDVIVESGRETDADHVIMTTWHARETLDDALWFALFTSFPAAAYEATCRATVVVAIDARRYADQLRRNLADPEAFSERILARTKHDDADSAGRSIARGSDSVDADRSPSSPSQP